MTDFIEPVRRFHEATGAYTADRIKIPPKDVKQLRIRLIEEEVNKELLPALQSDDMEGIADGCGDAIVVIVGTALAYGIPLDKVYEAIDKANMAKVDPKTGKVRRREDGKILKPEGWLPPDITGILKEEG